MNCVKVKADIPALMISFQNPEMALQYANAALLRITVTRNWQSFCQCVPKEALFIFLVRCQSSSSSLVIWIPPHSSSLLYSCMRLWCSSMTPGRNIQRFVCHQEDHARAKWIQHRRTKFKVSPTLNSLLRSWFLRTCASSENMQHQYVAVSPSRRKVFISGKNRQLKSRVFPSGKLWGLQIKLSPSYGLTKERFISVS